MLGLGLLLLVGVLETLALTLSTSSSPKSFFSQTGLTASDDVFHIEKSFGIRIEIESSAVDVQNLPAFLKDNFHVVSDEPSSSSLTELWMQAQEVSSPNFAEIAAYNTNAGSTWKMNAEGEMVLSKLHSNVPCHHVSAGKQEEEEEEAGEFLLFERFLHDFSTQTQRPAFLVYHYRHHDLSALSALLEKHEKLMLQQKDTICTLVLHSPTPAVEQQRRVLGTKKGFSAEEYVMISWLLITLSIIGLFVFCCIPWAPELDQGLKASLKSKAD